VPGTFKELQPVFARDAIGQADVLATPLEMALVAESVATGGTMLVPHLLAQVENTDTTVARTASVQSWRRVMSPATAETLTAMMRSVVERGTGTAAAIPGIPVAGKTGTSQTVKGRAPHAWFIGFAPANAPKYAVAVLVEHGGDLGNEATGGRVAAPIARDVLLQLLTPR
jgi:peptidoglycan glycosyltransferase